MHVDHLEFQANRLSHRLAPGRRIGLLGSTEPRHSKTPSICVELGHLFARRNGLLLLTGGLRGGPRVVSESYQRALDPATRSGDVAHVLPLGYEAPPFGSVHYVGTTLEHWRAVFARLSRVYVVVEGGPGTAEECTLARARGARLIPVAALRGAGGDFYSPRPPSWASATAWAVLARPNASSESLAAATAMLAAQALTVAETEKA